MGGAHKQWRLWGISGIGNRVGFSNQKGGGGGESIAFIPPSDIEIRDALFILLLINLLNLTLMEL